MAFLQRRQSGGVDTVVIGEQDAACRKPSCCQCFHSSDRQTHYLLAGCETAYEARRYHNIGQGASKACGDSVASPSPAAKSVLYLHGLSPA